MKVSAGIVFQGSTYIFGSPTAATLLFVPYFNGLFDFRTCGHVCWKAVNSQIVVQWLCGVGHLPK